MRKTRVRRHLRKKPSGGKTAVREHMKRIKEEDELSVRGHLEKYESTPPDKWLTFEEAQQLAQEYPIRDVWIQSPTGLDTSGAFIDDYESPLDGEGIGGEELRKATGEERVRILLTQVHKGIYQSKSYGKMKNLKFILGVSR